MGDLGTITIHVAFIRLLVVLPCAGPRTQAACQARGGAGRSGENHKQVAAVSEAVTTLRGLCSYLILP